LQDDRQRIDRWLWHARLVRTRTLAAKLAASGHVRLNGQRVAAPARAVRAGDVLTVALPDAVKVVRILTFAARRGGALGARELYEDLTPPLPREKATAPDPGRDTGSGRPTKRDRRALDRLRQRGSRYDG
jgi:ribosome-associated heat shock protein Hsp15